MYPILAEHIIVSAPVRRARMCGSDTMLRWEYLSPKSPFVQGTCQTCSGKYHLSGRWMGLGTSRLVMEQWITKTVWMLSHLLEWSAYYYRHAIRPLAW
jgi:hypothetical protein